MLSLTGLDIIPDPFFDFFLDSDQIVEIGVGILDGWNCASHVVRHPHQIWRPVAELRSKGRMGNSEMGKPEGLIAVDQKEARQPLDPDLFL